MNAINKEVAVEEIKNYLAEFLEVEFDVEKDYPKVLKAVESGRLSFNEEKRPVYTLIEPINKGGEFETKELVLKNRILPSVGADLFAISPMIMMDDYWYLDSFSFVATKYGLISKEKRDGVSYTNLEK